MAADGGTVELKYRARLDQLERDMAGVRSKVSRSADDAADGFTSRFTSKMRGLGGHMSSIGATLGKSLAFGIAGAALGAGALFKSAIDEAEEARKVGAQTAAVIQSTGGVANVSAAQVGKYADKLAALTGIDDETIASGENMLLTFTRVRNEVGAGNDIFNQGTKAALNMSVALGKDMNSSAMLVGKALNDPIGGMTALTRAGIQFTDQQKAQIKTMVAAGDTLGAQKIILKELETQFGGSAEAAASGAARFAVVWGNLKEELGARLLPVLNTAATFLADKLPGAMDAAGRSLAPVIELVHFAAAGFAAAFSGEGITSTGFVGTMERMGIAARQVYDFVKDNLKPVLIGLGVALALLIGPWFALGAAVVLAYTKFEGFRDVVNSVVTTVSAVISGFIDLVTTIWAQFGDQLTAYAQGAWTAISGVISGAMQVIQGIIQVVTAAIHGDWAAVWEGIKSILSGAVQAIVSLLIGGAEMMQAVFSAGLEILASIVRSAFEGIVGFIASIPGRIVGALGDLAGMLYRSGLGMMSAFADGIRDGVGHVLGAVGSVLSKARNLLPFSDAKTGPLSDLTLSGRRLPETFAKGIRSSSAIADALAASFGSGQDALSMAAAGAGGMSVSSLSHYGEGTSQSSNSGAASAAPIGPFIFNGVRQDDLPTEIPRRLRGALHMWT